MEFTSEIKEEYISSIHCDRCGRKFSCSVEDLLYKATDPETGEEQIICMTCQEREQIGWFPQ